MSKRRRARLPGKNDRTEGADAEKEAFDLGLRRAMDVITTTIAASPATGVFDRELRRAMREIFGDTQMTEEVARAAINFCLALSLAAGATIALLADTLELDPLSVIATTEKAMEERWLAVMRGLAPPDPDRPAA